MTEINDLSPVPPEDLPADAASFWESPPLPPRPEPRVLPSALERLGPSPFPKSKFPFLGFLATVYLILTFISLPKHRFVATLMVLCSHMVYGIFFIGGLIAQKLPEEKKAP